MIIYIDGNIENMGMRLISSIGVRNFLQCLA